MLTEDAGLNLPVTHRLLLWHPTFKRASRTPHGFLSIGKVQIRYTLYVSLKYVCDPNDIFLKVSAYFVWIPWVSRVSGTRIVRWVRLTVICLPTWFSAVIQGILAGEGKLNYFDLEHYKVRYYPSCRHKNCETRSLDRIVCTTWEFFNFRSFMWKYVHVQ